MEDQEVINNNSERISQNASSNTNSSDEKLSKNEPEKDTIQINQEEYLENASLDLHLNLDLDEDQETEEEEYKDEEQECLGTNFGPQCEEPYLFANKPLIPHLNADQMHYYNLPREEFFYDYGSCEYLTPYHRLSPSQERFYKIGTDGPDSHIPLYNKLPPESLKYYGLKKDELFYDEGSSEYLIVYNKLTPEQKVLYGLIESLKLARCDWSDKKDSPYGLTRKQKCMLIRQMLKRIREEEKLRDEKMEAENYRKQENKDAYDTWLKKKREAKVQELEDKKPPPCYQKLPPNFFRDPVLAFHVWLKMKDDQVKRKKFLNVKRSRSYRIATTDYENWTKTCFKRICDEF